MLQELADESDNHGLTLSKSKTKVVMETDTPIGQYVNNAQIENVESKIYWDRDIKTKTRKFKEE